MSTRRIVIMMLLFLTAGIALAAAAAVLIMRFAAWHGDAIEAYLLDKGPDRVMRRCILVIGIAFLAAFLKRAGWRGRRDCGLSSDPDTAISPDWRRQVWNGILIGLATLGGMSLLVWLLDIRIITPPADWSVMPRRSISYLLSGITVGLIEEIICRGILFRIFARIWRLWPAALMSSAIFALAHFFSPTPDAFADHSILSDIWRVYVDTFANVPRTDAFVLRFFNLTLLGVVLCAFLTRTGAVWLSIGAHAAWVWVIKFHHLFTDFNPARAPAGIWFGMEADFTDSLLATIMMLTMVWAAGGLRRRAPEFQILIRHAGLTWHAHPAHAERMRQWLARHFPTQPATGGAAPFTQPGAGRELKAYDGCRVTALDGVVMKAYWPRAGSPWWRFPFRPARTRRGFALAHELAGAGIPTPPAPAWSAGRRRGLRHIEYLATIELADATPLAERLTDKGAPAPSRAAFLTAYGRLAAMFHAKNYSNRDLKHENVMAGAEPENIWVVDLDGVRKRCRITYCRAARDLFRAGDCLATLGCAAPDDVRAFFSGYNQCVAPRLRRHEFPRRQDAWNPDGALR